MHAPRQLSFSESMASPKLLTDPGADHGEVFTRRWVVELILDLVGYTPDQDLAAKVLYEPSCGTGAFLVPVVDRLIESCTRHGRDLGTVNSALRAFDVLDANAELARKAVAIRLLEAGMTDEEADDIVGTWVQSTDFLLYDHAPMSADFVVGNPPYVRLESVFGPTMAAYRRVCSTMRGRSDLYVGFIERGLELMREGGVLGFICADRWMRNQYGADLRELIARSYAVDAVIAMHDVNAFEHEVSAYPAVIILRKGTQQDVLVAEADGSFDGSDAVKLASWAHRRRSRRLATSSIEASRIDGWFAGRDLWPTGTPAQLAVVNDLEARFPPLEDARTATRVGIGLATGCDDVYLTTETDDVEHDRLLPLLRAADTTTGVTAWSGAYLVNPWSSEGLVDLEHFPKLRSYLETHEARLRERHVGRRRPTQWYRTIDRVDPHLLATPKLVLPDMKASAHPVLDVGEFYPHHNLYFVVSEGWDLRVLGGLLLSEISNLFVGAYCVKMRGGCYRFQAQYLRRIRVPHRDALSKSDERALVEAFTDRDVEAATAVARRLYGLRDIPPMRELGTRRRS